MNPIARSISWRVAAAAACLMLLGGTQGSLAAEKQKIEESIQKAQQYLLRQKLTGPFGSVAALGFVKSGGDKTHPAIEAVANEITGKIRQGTYRPIQHYNYEAAVDLMLLDAVSGERYRPQIEAIATFLISTQSANGSWFYDHDLENDCGDTSITQYAVMGLWAASRNGILVPTDVLERAVKWHLSHQKEDGGFAYHPFVKKIPEEQTTTVTMTAAGSSTLLIIRRILFHEAEMEFAARPAENKRRFGLLERVTEDKPTRPVGMTMPTIRPTAIDKALKDSVKFTASHYIDRSRRTEEFFCYYMYSIERICALMEVDKLGTKDWYDEGSDELLKRQSEDGNWNDGSTPLAATAFGLMFLSKATSTVISPRKKNDLVGGGIQTGGRGLPDNLGTVQMKDGIVTSRKLAGQVDNLLIELERSAEAKVLDAQAAIVDAVQLDQPEELIGQVDRLRKLATDPRVEVRRTAMWALARSGNLSIGRILIDGLEDPDITVVREASLGLCILSRRPEGCGKTIDPTDDVQMGIKDSATDDERKAIITEWQKESKKRWYDWYQKVRPYDERDDRTMLRSSLKQ